MSELQKDQKPKPKPEPLKKLRLYDEMNGGAHRKPASILGAPSIVRHLVFWDVHSKEEKFLCPTEGDETDKQTLPPAPTAPPKTEAAPASPSASAEALAYEPAQGLEVTKEADERSIAAIDNPPAVASEPTPAPEGNPQQNAKSQQHSKSFFASIRRLFGKGFPPADLPKTEDAPEADHQACRRKNYLDYLDALSEVIASQADPLKPKSGECDPPKPALDATSNKALAGRNSADIFCFWWNGLRVTIRLEMEAEYVSLTSIIDLSLQTSEEVATPQKNCAEVDELKSAFSELKESFDTKVQEKGIVWEDLHRRLNTRIWQYFQDNILNPGNILAINLGYLFADFRGLITGTECAANAKESKFRPVASCPERVGSIDLSATPRPAAPRPDDRWRRDVLNRLWPLIKSEHGSPEFEFTASGYLDGRAVFVSALGPQPGEKRSNGGGEDVGPLTGAPLNYYLHTQTHDEWQLGRLVNRIHHVATLRLAALARIGALMEAGDIAEEVIPLMEAADEAIQKAMNALASPRPADDEGKRKYREAMEAPQAAIDRAEKKLSEINILFPLDITVRLEKSLDYIERFNAGADMFRVKRIEGFQIYKEFVSRRMDGLFGYITLLYRRINDLWSIRAKLHERNANFQAATTSREIRRLTREISKIQDFGEIALIGILLPYYLGSLVYHIFKGNLELEGVEGLYWLISTGIFALMAASMLAGQLIRQKKSEPHKRDTSSKPKVFFLAFVVFILLLGFHAWHLPLKEAKGQENSTAQKEG